MLVSDALEDAEAFLPVQLVQTASVFRAHIRSLVFFSENVSSFFLRLARAAEG